MELIQLFLIIATLLWTGGGLVFFSWLYNQRIKRFTRNSWKGFKEFVPHAALFLAMMGPFYIPFIVSALCLFFG